MSIKTTVAGLTHVGCVRRNNEDSIFFASAADDTALLAVVADGMGGHAGGAVASELVVSGYAQAWRVLQDACIWPDWLLHTAGNVHRDIRRRAVEEPALNQMGTTLVAALIADRQLHVAHVGDSRCYRFDGHDLWQVTRDHSLVQQMVDEGTLTAEQAERSPIRNYLTRSLGSQAATVDVQSMALAAGDRVLLCSDGLTNMMAPREIAAVLAAGAADDDVCASLLETALARGATDNVSIIVCTVQ